MGFGPKLNKIPPFEKIMRTQKMVLAREQTGLSSRAALTDSGHKCGTIRKCFAAR
jgi:hypothetical protein